MTKPNKFLLDKEWLIDQYINLRKSESQIARELGCQQETVSKYIHKYEISLRSHSEEISGERHPLYGKHFSEESKRKMSESLSGENNPNFGKKRPEHSQKMSGSGNPRYGIKLEKDQVEKQRISLLQFYDNNPEAKEKAANNLRCNRITRRGPESNLWKGGISFEPYCPKFNNNLKERVRSFFGYGCLMCGKTTEENNNINLCVHHVEYDKNACCHGKPVHFASLCHRCHSKTNYERERWEAMLHRIIDEIYDGRSYYTQEEYKNIKLKPKIQLKEKQR